MRRHSGSTLRRWATGDSHDPKAIRARERSEMPLDELARRHIPMSVAQVAAVLGMSAQGVRNIEERALRKLRAALDDE